LPQGPGVPPLDSRLASEVRELVTGDGVDFTPVDPYVLVAGGALRRARHHSEERHGRENIAQ
jgi:hypothetical protein